jgi:hypothetical protein
MYHKGMHKQPQHHGACANPLCRPHKHSKGLDLWQTRGGVPGLPTLRAHNYVRLLAEVLQARLQAILCAAHH